MDYKSFLHLLLFAGLVYAPLAAGAAARHIGVIRKDLSRPVMAACWLFLEPIAIAISFWSLDLQQVGNLISAPLLGMIWMLAMMAVAMAASKKMHLSALQQGNVVLATMFSNNGITLGAFLCLILIGIEGQALASLFILTFLPLLLTIGFAVGRRSNRKAALDAGTEHREAPSMGVMRIVPYSAMALGFALNLAGVTRPGFALPLNRGVVYADVAVYSFAIGTLFRLGSVRKYISKCLAVSALKFIVSPILGLSLFLFGSMVFDLSPMMLQVMVVQCAMPVAIMSVVVSRFFHLDTEFAAALWVFTTLAVAGVVFLLAVIVPGIG